MNMWRIGNRNSFNAIFSILTVSQALFWVSDLLSGIDLSGTVTFTSFGAPFIRAGIPRYHPYLCVPRPDFRNMGVDLVLRRPSLVLTFASGLRHFSQS